MNKMGNLDNLGPELLKVLAAVLEHESTTRAGMALGVSQSAVSHALRKLRHAFNDELLIRVGNKLVPTERGIELRPRVDRVLADIERLFERSVPFDPRNKFRITIAINAYGELVFLPRVLRALRKEAPNCELRMEAINEHRLEEDFLSSRIDIAIGRPFPIFESAKRRLLLTDEYVSCVWAKHPLATKRRVGLHEFLSYPHAVVATSGGASSIDRALERLGKSRNRTLRVGHFLNSPFLILGTEHILTGHRSMLEALSEHLPLRLFPTPLKLAKLKIHMFWQGRDDKKPANKWMRQFLVRTLC